MEGQKLKNNQGFILVELLITLAITSIIVVVSSEFLINLVNTSVKIQSRNEVEQDYNFLTTKLTKMIQDSGNVSYSVDTLNFTLGTTSYNLKFDANSDILLNGIQLNTVDIEPLPNSDLIKFNSSTSVQNVQLNFRIIKDANNKFRSYQDVERIITIRKSYND